MSYDIARKTIYEKMTPAFRIDDLEEDVPATKTEVIMDQFGGLMIWTSVEGVLPVTTVHLDAEAVAAIKNAVAPLPE